MKIVIRQSESLDDWYLIEKADHEGRMWLESTGTNSLRLMCSSRISNADIEGSSEEMVEIARAIKNRGEISFRRCAVRCLKREVHFWSPRNSNIDGIVTIEEANELADQILSELTSGSPQRYREGR